MIPSLLTVSPECFQVITGTGTEDSKVNTAFSLKRSHSSRCGKYMFTYTYIVFIVLSTAFSCLRRQLIFLHHKSSTCADQATKCFSKRKCENFIFQNMKAQFYIYLKYFKWYKNLSLMRGLYATPGTSRRPLSMYYFHVSTDLKEMPVIA